MSLDCVQSHRQGATGSDSIAHPVGRKDWACAAFPQHSTSTGCPTKQAQSILWGNAAEHLSSKDVHSQTLGAAQPHQSQASRNGWDDGALLVFSSGCSFHTQAPWPALPGSCTC